MFNSASMVCLPVQQGDIVEGEEGQLVKEGREGEETERVRMRMKTKLCREKEII